MSNSSQDDDRLTSLMTTYTSTSAPSPSTTLAYKSYLARLHSYSPRKYFAKPDTISPQTCSLHGWTCESLDLLVCHSCEAKLSVYISDVLPVASADELGVIYEEKLTSGHKPFCSYQFTCCPSSFLEYPVVNSSVEVIRERCEAASKIISGLDLRCNIPTSKSYLDFVERVKERVELDGVPKGVFTLALFNWEVVVDVNASNDEDDEDLSKSSVELMCNLCGAASSACKFDTNESPRKKIKRVREICPIDEHRYYCPVVTNHEGGSDVGWHKSVRSVIANNSKSKNDEYEQNENENEEKSIGDRERMKNVLEYLKNITK